MNRQSAGNVSADWRPAQGLFGFEVDAVSLGSGAAVRSSDQGTEKGSVAFAGAGRAALWVPCCVALFSH
jgi:hypothetical protein